VLEEEEMGKNKRFVYLFQIENDDPKSFSAHSFPVQGDGFNAFLVFYEGMGGPKTPMAIIDWARTEKKVPPLWCEWDKPKAIGSGSASNATTEDLCDRELWLPDTVVSNASFKRYAETVARVQFAGEHCPRRLRVTFVWRWLNGQPQTHGGSYEIEDLGSEVPYTGSGDLVLDDLRRLTPVW
jgi:hypothetical protein